MKSSILLSVIFTVFTGLFSQNIQATPVSVQTTIASTASVNIQYDSWSETLYVKLYAPKEKGRVQITVYNSIGKVIAEEMMKYHGKPDGIKIDLSGVESGMYKVVVELPHSDYSDRFRIK